MTSTLQNVVIDAADAAELATFWASVTGWQPADWNSPDEAVVRNPAGGVSIYFMRVPEEKAGKNRVHLDIAPSDGATASSEIARLVDLGAKVLAEHESHTVLADIEGNEFCVTGERD
ncbi:VOC family protein [Streptomyces vilmorinianum]|uniref:VOC family protein n=1 Tax=Streptomyces vilmorinianum TaxID=3051092 RepID=UPI0010FB96BF|nr:VOC family protein [Streptomyces vilmorinianum]